MNARRIVFGLVLPSAAASGSEIRARVDRLLKIIADRVDREIERYDAESYESLATEVREARVDVAWLPPIVVVRLGDDVTPIGSVLRKGRYEAALVTRSDSPFRTIEDLRGARAGWVDRWSAAGFVLPRVHLKLRGVDPRSVFRTETFHGSHRAAMQALADGACDVAGTYARADEPGTVTAGAWSEIDGVEVRVLATFGAIPPDVIGARKGLPEEDRMKLLEALREACVDASTRKLVRDIFNGDVLREGLVSDYDSLKSALETATAQGLFD